LALYRDNPGFVRPETRRNEVLRFVEGGLRDLSVSRTSFDWGVKVPGAEDHVMYVWVDALTNYLTGVGYPDETDTYRKFWPADLHLIGKDIVRFHAVYWPAFLMSAGVPLPKAVFAHGFLLNRGTKESKSLGNTTDPATLADSFGVDPLRYFLLREFSFGQDGSWSPEAIVSRNNAELANSFGNLAQRTLSLIYKNCDGVLPPILAQTEDDLALFALIERAIAKDIPTAFEQLAFSQALESWMSAVFACNAYIDAQAPWTLKKNDFERMRTVLATLYVVIAELAVAVSPVMPGSMARLLEAMGVAEDLRTIEGIRSTWYSPLAESHYRLSRPVGLFPRLELPEEAAA
jgi:methionyl-tRNA synthetase